MTFLSVPLESLLAALYALSALTAASHALLHKRDPRSAWGWIAVCWLFPLAGALLYYWFGINHIHIRAVRRLGRAPAVRGLAGDAAPVLPPQVPGAHPAELQELVRIGEAMTGLPLVAGNRIEPLFNGEQAYPAMLDAIDQARHSVHLATYIFLDDAVGQQFATRLAAAQARGVNVKVLLDGVADALYRPRPSSLLKRHGLRPALFLPPRWWPLMAHVNLRNHCKLLLVDSETGFTGGMNIAEYHLAAVTAPGRVSDVHFRVRGPIVRQMQETFIRDWCLATGERGALATTAVPETGHAFARVITDGPNEKMDKLVMVLLGALANAHQRVWIMTPYFLPMPVLGGALEAAALRGVEVCIFLPERSDQPWIDWATRNLLRTLLARQVQVYYQPPPFAHAKLLLVDDYYVQFGSANLDPRSLRLNFELVVEAYDRELAQRLAAHFESARSVARPVTLQEILRRSLAVRLRDALCWLFSPYL